MSDPYLGEIRLFAGNFAPWGWEFCHGQLLSIAEEEPLFSLIGTRYGGNGMTTFALPDLRGRVPIHQGQGAGLSSRPLASAGGREHVTLTLQQIPEHTHVVRASAATATSRTAVGNAPASLPGNGKAYSTAAADEVIEESSPVGGGQPHTNLQPYLGINYIIALWATYPSRG